MFVPDVIIRAYRKLGIDLQKEVHEDMKKNFSKYPKKFGLKKPDTNIDHRRVPNLMVFFAKFGQSKSIETNPALYAPGDIVTWLLPGNLTHIGIVVNKKSADGKRYLIVHNIGAGQVIEDCLLNSPLPDITSIQNNFMMRKVVFVLFLFILNLSSAQNSNLKIIDKPINYSAERIQLSLEYLKEHYGFNSKNADDCSENSRITLHSWRNSRKQP
ncbi:DUF1287 domain-containing protein [Chryseobacterium indoltheticum]|uniref:DUF1287 domain-containing protein n=1 Tax=Chryseobacterium indoltheticum TaxID=254 RepID=UPI003F491A91